MATRKASDNRFPLVRLVTIDDTPATPPAGEVHLVAGVDMVLRYVDEDANVYELGLAGAGVPDGTDPGDLLAWDGAAWDVLPIGTDGDVLTADSGEALGLAYTTPSVGGGGSIDPGLESLWSTPTIVATEDDHFTGPSLAGKWLAYTGFDATTSFPLDSWVSLTSGAKLQPLPVGTPRPG